MLYHVHDLAKIWCSDCVIKFCMSFAMLSYDDNPIAPSFSSVTTYIDHHIEYSALSCRLIMKIFPDL